MWIHLIKVRFFHAFILGSWGDSVRRNGSVPFFLSLLSLASVLALPFARSLYRLSTSELKIDAKPNFKMVTPFQREEKETQFVFGAALGYGGI